MKRLTLTKESKTDLLTDQQISDLVDDFLAGQLRQSQQCEQDQGNRVALRLELERLERGAQ